jgi:hypothetical protein
LLSYGDRRFDTNQPQVEALFRFVHERISFRE